MSSLDAQRLSDETGSLFSEAKSVLESIPDYGEAKETLRSLLLHRRRVYETSVLTSAWTKFAPITTKELGIDETIDFIQKLGLQLEDPVVLAIAYELQAPQTGVFKQQQFIDGFARNEAKDFDYFKTTVVPLLAQRFDTEDYFRYVYRYTYKFLIATENSRTLDLQTSKDYWALLLLPKYPETIERWLQFVNVDFVSSDTWNMLLEFCLYARSDPDFERYDDSSAWPMVFDDFVEYVNG